MLLWVVLCAWRGALVAPSTSTSIAACKTQKSNTNSRNFEFMRTLARALHVEVMDDVVNGLGSDLTRWSVSGFQSSSIAYSGSCPARAAHPTETSNHVDRR